MSQDNWLAEELVSLLSRTGPDVLQDADELAAVLDDHLAHRSTDQGVLNLLVDAVRQGAADRLLRDVAHGADPARAVETHGDRLARDRVTAELGPSRWAVADDDDGDGGAAIEGSAEQDCTSKFSTDSAMAALAESGTITVGAGADHPGLGHEDPTTGQPAGFDLDIAKLLVAGLCIDPLSSSVAWVPVRSSEREVLLEQGRVDLVASTYAITDERRRRVGQAGPYLVTGQQLLVRIGSDIDSIDDLRGERVCAVEGSTSALSLEAHDAVLDPAQSYDECVQRVVDGRVAATSTDGATLLGLAKQHSGEVEVVGPPLSEERYGIGYARDAEGMCPWITDVLARAFDDGAWARAFRVNLGGPRVSTPTPPTLDPCA